MDGSSTDTKPAAPSSLHRALRWSLPGVAFVSLPFGMTLQVAIATRFGMQGLVWGPTPTGPWGISSWTYLNGAKVVAGVAAFSAIIAIYYARRIRTRPLLRFAIILFDLTVLAMVAWFFLTAPSREQYMMTW